MPSLYTELRKKIKSKLNPEIVQRKVRAFIKQKKGGSKPEKFWANNPNRTFTLTKILLNLWQISQISTAILY